MNLTALNAIEKTIIIILAFGCGFFAFNYLHFINKSEIAETNNEKVVASKEEKNIVSTEKDAVLKNKSNNDAQDNEPYYLQNAELKNLLSKLNKPEEKSFEPEEGKVDKPAHINVTTNLIIDKPENSNLSYAELFSSVEGLVSALRKLKPAKNELELVRLLSIIDSIVTAWSRGRYSYDPERVVIINLLVEQWEEHSDILTANKCIYCGSYFRLMSGLININGTNEEWRTRAVKIHPRHMQLSDTSDSLSQETRVEYAKHYARLIKAGDAHIARYIGHILLKSGNYDDYAYWALGGLNGSNSIAVVKDYSTLPREYLYNIWESGMRGAHVNEDLTVYLFSTGYRPAFRFIIWHLDGGASYLKNHPQMTYDKYIEAIQIHTTFPSKRGVELSRFYSENWKRIDWDKKKEVWRL